jgi:hypothetical protein
VAINNLTKIYVRSDTIALLAHQIRLHAVVQTSIKICKANQLVSLLALRDISAQIVQGHNVSHRKVNYHSIVMGPRKLQSIAVLELIIQLMDQTASQIVRIALLVTIVLIQLVKQR